MKKKYLFFIILIPVCILLTSIVTDPFGYIISINKENKGEIEKILPNYDINKVDTIILDCKPRENNNGYFMKSLFNIDKIEIGKEDEFVEYAKKNGIETHMIATVLDFISIVIVGGVMITVRAKNAKNRFEDFGEEGEGNSQNSGQGNEE